MNAVCYRNTLTDLPGWVDDVHVEHCFGYAFETDTHFVHLYGKETFYIISVGLTVLEAKRGTLDDWIAQHFGAADVKPMALEVGTAVKSIWRPSLYSADDIQRAIGSDASERVSQENALRVLVQRLDELLLYVEPSVTGLSCFSHKTRELLILACTEVENQWRSLLQTANCTPTSGSRFTTLDYSKLIGKVHLEEFAVSLRNGPVFRRVQPFAGWNAASPTQSLSWYDAYNATKHNREQHFDRATLEAALQAVAANLILYSVRFGPLSLVNSSHALAALINQMFEIEMLAADRSSFYLPKIDTSSVARSDCFVIDSYRMGLNRAWTTVPLIL